MKKGSSKASVLRRMRELRGVYRKWCDGLWVSRTQYHLKDVGAGWEQLFHELGRFRTAFGGFPELGDAPINCNNSSFYVDGVALTLSLAKVYTFTVPFSDVVRGRIELGLIPADVYFSDVRREVQERVETPEHQALVMGARSWLSREVSLSKTP